MTQIEGSSPKLSPACILCQNQPSDATHSHVQICSEAGKWPPRSQEGGNNIFLCPQCYDTSLVIYLPIP